MSWGTVSLGRRITLATVHRLKAFRRHYCAIYRRVATNASHKNRELVNHGDTTKGDRINEQLDGLHTAAITDPLKVLADPPSRLVLRRLTFQLLLPAQQGNDHLLLRFPISPVDGHVLRLWRIYTALQIVELSVIEPIVSALLGRFVGEAGFSTQNGAEGVHAMPAPRSMLTEVVSYLQNTQLHSRPLATAVAHALLALLNLDQVPNNTASSTIGHAISSVRCPEHHSSLASSAAMRSVDRPSAFDPDAVSALLYIVQGLSGRRANDDGTLLSCGPVVFTELMDLYYFHLFSSQTVPNDLLSLPLRILNRVFIVMFAHYPEKYRETTPILAVLYRRYLLPRLEFPMTDIENSIPIPLLYTLSEQRTDESTNGQKAAITMEAVVSLLNHSFHCLTDDARAAYTVLASRLPASAYYYSCGDRKPNSCAGTSDCTPSRAVGEPGFSIGLLSTRILEVCGGVGGRVTCPMTWPTRYLPYTLETIAKCGVCGDARVIGSAHVRAFLRACAQRLETLLTWDKAGNGGPGPMDYPLNSVAGIGRLAECLGFLAVDRVGLYSRLLNCSLRRVHAIDETDSNKVVTTVLEGYMRSSSHSAEAGQHVERTQGGIDYIDMDKWVSILRLVWACRVAENNPTPGFHSVLVQVEKLLLSAPAGRATPLYHVLHHWERSRLADDEADLLARRTGRRMFSRRAERINKESTESMIQADCPTTTSIDSNNDETSADIDNAITSTNPRDTSSTMCGRTPTFQFSADGRIGIGFIGGGGIVKPTTMARQIALLRLFDEPPVASPADGETSAVVERSAGNDISWRRCCELWCQHTHKTAVDNPYFVEATQHNINLLTSALVSLIGHINKGASKGVQCEGTPSLEVSIHTNKAGEGRFARGQATCDAIEGTAPTPAAACPLSAPLCLKIRTTTGEVSPTNEAHNHTTLLKTYWIRVVLKHEEGLPAAQLVSSVLSGVRRRDGISMDSVCTASTTELRYFLTGVDVLNERIQNIWNVQLPRFQNRGTTGEADHFSSASLVVYVPHEWSQQAAVETAAMISQNCRHHLDGGDMACH